MIAPTFHLAASFENMRVVALVDLGDVEQIRQLSLQHKLSIEMEQRVGDNILFSLKKGS